MDSIVITCKTNETLQLSELTEFQGGLKKRDNSDIEKIITSIKKYGFSFPFFVWKNIEKNNVLDGHGRILALREMEKQGVTIPPLPVVYIECADEVAAKNKLLRLNSQFGQMTRESVLDFTVDIDVDFLEVNLLTGSLYLDTDIDLDIGDDDFLQDGEVNKEKKQKTCPHCGGIL